MAYLLGPLRGHLLSHLFTAYHSLLTTHCHQIKSSVLDKLQRDRDDYQEGQARARAQQQALRTMGLDAGATNEALAAATEAWRVEVEHAL